MADSSRTILLFHHALGLSTGVQEVAGALRDAGHTVHAPDLFEGRVFERVEEGVDFAQKTLGGEEVARRADAAAADLPPDIVYVGMSLGAVQATRLTMTRPGALGLVSLYGAIPPTWLDATWPVDVPAQTHQSEGDPWREAEADEDFVAQVPGAQMFLYEGDTHLFADPGNDDFDPTAAALAMERILGFLDAL
jgi:dienelactone hydrolase